MECSAGVQDPQYKSRKLSREFFHNRYSVYSEKRTCFVSIYQIAFIHPISPGLRLRTWRMTRSPFWMLERTNISTHNDSGSEEEVMHPNPSPVVQCVSYTVNTPSTCKLGTEILILFSSLPLCVFHYWYFQPLIQINRIAPMLLHRDVAILLTTKRGERRLTELLASSVFINHREFIIR